MKGIDRGAESDDARCRCECRDDRLRELAGAEQASGEHCRPRYPRCVAQRKGAPWLADQDCAPGGPQQLGPPGRVHVGLPAPRRWAGPAVAASLSAVVISATWLNAWGQLPSRRWLLVSYSTMSMPVALRRARR